MMSVSDLERITGFELFPMISDGAESVKDSYTVTDWVGTPTAAAGSGQSKAAPNRYHAPARKL
jgi:hypothetical protein